MIQEEERITNKALAHPALAFVSDWLSEHPNGELYIVGGAVRDLLMQRPMREADFDLVITGIPHTDIESWFSARGTLDLVGQRFGVYKFMPKGFSPKQLSFIDIALPRTEQVRSGSLGGYKDFDIQSDPHLPIERDLARRDFTVNAMALTVREKRIVDPFSGMADLHTKTIRAVGTPTERFEEDLSRMLRGIRFAAELTFDLEEETSKAIKELIGRVNTQIESDGRLEYVVPRETVGVELAKALSRNPARAVILMKEHHVLSECFPALTNMEDAYYAPLSKAQPRELTATLTALLRALSAQEVRDTLAFTGLSTLPRHKLLRTETQDIVHLTHILQQPRTAHDITSLAASVFEKQYMNGRGRVLLRCLELLGRTEELKAAMHRRRTIEDRWLVDQDESIAPLISGQDILALGIEPGPQIRIILEQVRNKQLDGELLRREDALEWLKQNTPA